MSRNKINRKRQPQPSPATAAIAATAKALHTVHSNSFVGFGGSDLSNRQGQDINKHDDDDVMGGNDLGSCDDEDSC